MRSILMILFGAGALWDVTTTIYGTWNILNGNNFFALIASIAFGLVILALLASTLWIWKKEGVFGLGFKIFWCISIIYDLATSWNGNLSLLFQGRVNGVQYLLLIGLTLFMSLSPIAWTYVQSQSELDFQ